MQADMDKADDELCSGMTNCTSCVDAVLSDGESTCQWFAMDGDNGYCGSGCGMDGCGATACPTTLPEEDMEPGTPVVLPECEVCTGTDGMCYGVGEEWFMEDGCAKCTCDDEEGSLSCVGCPLEILPETGTNLIVEQEGADCGGIALKVGCVLMSDETIACEDYAPTSNEGCNIEVKYTYYARQEAPPTDVILTSIIRTREDSFHGSPRDIADNRWGQNLTPTSMAYYELNSWEGEFHNFCLRSIPPPTIFEFMTDACTTTATYTIVAQDLSFVPRPTIQSGEEMVPADGTTVEKLEGGMDDMTSSASGLTIRFVSVVAVGGMFMMW